MKKSLNWHMSTIILFNDNVGIFLQSCAVIVTGSAKTGHNRTSLNLQYKALNTLGTYLRIVKKIKFFERFFLSERKT